MAAAKVARNASKCGASLVRFLVQGQVEKPRDSGVVLVPAGTRARCAIAIVRFLSGRVLLILVWWVRRAQHAAPLRLSRSRVSQVQDAVGFTEALLFGGSFLRIIHPGEG